MELPDLPAVGSFFGVLTLLVWLIVRLMRQASGDRGDYQQVLASVREQHASTMADMIDRHDREIGNLRNEVQHLREELDEMRQQLQEERRGRWKAEDKVAYYRRILGEVPGEPSDDS